LTIAEEYSDIKDVADGDSGEFFVCLAKWN
jgi:hypothetical protein